MQLDDYVRQWGDQLSAVTALADDRTREVATALGEAGAAAARLVLLEALSAAAAEVTEGLLDTPGSPAVSLRLDGSQVHLDLSAVTVPEAAAVAADERDAGARVTVRMPERIKIDLDKAADRDGVSLNTWIVRALTAALSRTASGASAPRHNPHRITGWVNG